MADETTAEFLKRTTGRGGTGAQSAEEDPAKFLARTAPKAGETRVGVTPNDISGEGRDEYGQPTGTLTAPAPTESAVPNAFSSIAGMRNALQPEPGWVPSGVLPMATREVSPGQGDINAGVKWDLGPVRPVGNALLDLMEGTGWSDQGGASPLAGKVSPDASALLFSAMAGNPNPLVSRGRLWSHGGPTGAPGTAPPFASELMDRRVAEVMRPPGGEPPPPDGAPSPGMGGPPGGGPSPGMGGGPAPRSAGAAATPAGEAVLTPEQAAEYGSVADKQWLYKSKPPGEADSTEYVKGITPTMAQREQTVQAARETKTQRNLSPEAAQDEAMLLDEHNTIRKNEIQQIAGSDVTQGNAIRAAEERIDTALESAYSKGGEVDGAPVAEAIQAELNSPSGKLPPVRAVMKAISDAMQKSDGSGVETDPRQWHGVRRVINFYQSKHGIAENPSYGAHDVQAALQRVKETLDSTVEPAAPGFGEAIADYAKARQAFDVNEALQKAEAKLYDDKGRMQFSKIHRLMNEVIQSRDPRAPLNPWQGMTEAQLNRLKSLHDDLMRVATAEDLAKARGSDTTPSLIDAVKSAAQGVPGTIAAGVAGHIFGGPGGAVVGPIIKGQVEGIFTRRAERAATEKMGNLLRPDPTKYPTRPNPLNEP